MVAIKEEILQIKVLFMGKGVFLQNTGTKLIKT
jgi:hypothetical protein